MPFQLLMVIISLQATITSGQTNSTEGGASILPSQVQFLRGRDGSSGRDGRDGIVGPQGPPGFPGFPGHKGEQGEHGDTGPKGMKGAVGDVMLATGPRGLPGPPGIEGPQGITGSQGPMGQDGRPGTSNTPSGGVTYTRWGVSSCPTGADTLYRGSTGSSFHGHQGGAANYLCMPNDPQYTIAYQFETQGNSFMYGVEYEGPPLVPNREQHNAPCAVCYISNKMTTVMIPAKTDCPRGWMKEYYGYLMSERINNYRTEFVCVDSIMESITGRENNDEGGHFYHVEAHCNGMACPPYNDYKELTCVVCSK